MKLRLFSILTLGGGGPNSDRLLDLKFTWKQNGIFSKRTEMNFYLKIYIVFKKDQTWYSCILKYTIFYSF